MVVYKGGQVTKPIIVVKIWYKLLYVIQVVKKTFNKYCIAGKFGGFKFGDLPILSVWWIFIWWKPKNQPLLHNER